MNEKKDLADVRSFFIGKKEASDRVKRERRNFVAAVQKLYHEYIAKLMKMGKGYKESEDYVPSYLYPQMLRKAAEYNKLSWNETEFVRDMSHNKKREYYCANDLLDKISRSLGNAERSGYKITEYYKDNIEIEKGIEALIISACLFREGNILCSRWNEKVKDMDSAIPDSFFKENGLIILYYLLFETDCNMKIRDKYKNKYEELLNNVALDKHMRIRVETIIILQYFMILMELFNGTEYGDLLKRIGIYRKQLINGIGNDVLDNTEGGEENNG